MGAYISSVSRAMRLLLLGRKKTERAHVVQPVRKLHHNDANVVDHGEEHFADILSLPRLGSEQIQAADFRDAFDQAGDVRTKPLHDSRRGNAGVFHYIVQQGGAKRRNVQLHVRQDVRHFEGMREVRVSGLAQLRAVLFRRRIRTTGEAAQYRPQDELAELSRPVRGKRDCSARVRALGSAADERGQTGRFFN